MIRPLLKLFIKIFVDISVVYTVVSLLLDYLGRGAIQPTSHYVISTLFFALMFALIGTLMQYEGLKALGVKDWNDDILKPSQSKEIISSISPEVLVTGLKNNPSFNNIETNAESAVISLKHKISWTSWGEKIQIKCTSTETNGYTYVVSSAPLLSLTLIDQGRNVKNILTIEQIMTSYDHRFDGPTLAINS